MKISHFKNFSFFFLHIKLFQVLISPPSPSAPPLFCYFDRNPKLFPIKIQKAFFYLLISVGEICEVDNERAVDTKEVGGRDGFFDLARLHAYGFFFAGGEVDLRLAQVSFGSENLNYF